MFEASFDIEPSDVEKAYSVREDDDVFAIVVEFEKSEDAKEFAKDIEKDLDEILDMIVGDEYDEDEYSVERSGKIVIFGHEDMIKEIW